MSDLPIDADSIPRRTFTVGRKGFEQHEVRAYLQQVAEVVARLQRAELELRERADRADARAEMAENLDEHRLIEIVGEETARVLDAARNAAAEIKGKAEESAARVVRDGHDEIAALRARAEEELAAARAKSDAEVAALREKAERVLADKTAEAERAVEQRTRDLDAEIERRRADELREVERDVSAAKAEAEAAREEGKRMVAEAQAVRERVLRDLAKRRRKVRKQVERLNAGRERLLAAFENVRGAADESMRELHSSLPEARIAGEAAARRVEDELEDTLEQLEAELAAARANGLPIIDVDDDGDSDDDDADDIDDTDTGEHDAITDDRPAGGQTTPAPAVVIDDLTDPDAVVSGASLSAAIEAPPVPDAGPDQVVERRSSTLRLFRKRSEAVEAGADSASWVEVEAPDDIEAIHVVAPEPAPAAVPEPELAPTTGFEPSVVAEDAELVAEDAEGADSEAEPASPVRASADDVFAKMRAERAAPAAAEAVDETVGDATTTVDEPDASEPDESVAGEGSAVEGDDGEVETDGDDAAIFAARDEVLVGLERDLAKKVKRVLADEQNEVLDRIRRVKPKTVDEIVPALHEEPYVEAVADALAVAARAGAEAIDGSLDAVPDDLSAAFAQAMVAPLRERIDRSIDAAGGDNEELSDRVRFVYRDLKGRINDSVRHALAAAYARGAFLAAPDGAGLRWAVDQSEGSCGACPDCDDNALGGAVTKGKPFPTGDEVAPAHPGCRCMVLPDHR